MDSPAALLELLAQVPDSRRAQGRRHSLSAILALVVVAMLCGMNSLEAICQFGRERGKDLLYPLGFSRRRGLSKATLSRVLRSIDVSLLETLISRWVLAQLQSKRREFDQICLDGKSLRGSAETDPQTGERLPAQHLLAAYAPQVQSVLAQLRVDGEGNEYTCALRMLGVLPVKNKVLSGDAMFTQKPFCQEVTDGGGDYVLYAKANQPNLVNDIRMIFEKPEPTNEDVESVEANQRKSGDNSQAETETETESDWKPPQDLATASEVDKGHGRREKRTIWTTKELNKYLGWAGVNQVFRLERIRRIGGKMTREVAYGLTSLCSGAGELLARLRRHWQLEALHWIRDETMEEDRCRARKGSSGQVMACLRNVTIGLLAKVKAKIKQSSYAGTIRHLACHWEKALGLVSTPV